MRRILYLSVLVILACAVQPAGCSETVARFQLSNLQVVPAIVEISEPVTISIDVENVGNAEGSYLVNCSLDNVSEGLKHLVTLEPQETRKVAFNYTPVQEGQYKVSVDGLSQVLFVTMPVEGMWRIPYRVVDGKITMTFSLAGMTPVVNTVEFPSTIFDMYVSKEEVNGSRRIIIDSDSFVSEPVTIENIMRGIDMDLQFTLREDAVGELYVWEGACDVDVLSIDNDGSAETRFGDGLADAPGSELMFSPSEGQSYISVGQHYIVPMEVYSTTGNSSSRVLTTGRMNGSVLECQGIPFTKDGGVAPYVGTEATIVSTGSSLNRRFSGFRVDFQFMTIMKIEPIE